VVPRIWFIVPAAGASRRLGGPVAKPYLELAGRRVIEHTLDALLSQASVAGGVVVLAADDREWPTLPLALRERVTTTLGGRERCDSVLAGLRALSSAARDDWVLVHDAARPCVRHHDLRSLVDTLACHEVGGLLGVPVSDTMKRTDTQGTVSETVDRRGLWHAHTPQMFRYGLLKTSLEQALRDGYQVTDEASAIEHAGYSPLMVEGHADNIKITRPGDLPLAEFFLQQQGRL
jgi:2-C-methyl-D-erythritol 4-phosphate cytidylyltransferase